jgi:three-Cys-motif partner protein
LPLVQGDDGWPAEEVGSWVREKHTYLSRYLDSSRGARGKYLGPDKSGATFLDLISSCGRAKIRDTSEFVDGSAVAAWRISVQGRAPFTKVHIADIEDARRSACAHRLRVLGAPVNELRGVAVDAAVEYVKNVDVGGLHFAFLDPHSLGALDFRMIETLSRLRHIDMLIHVSVMDLQRNLGTQLALPEDEAAEFDAFAPGWRRKVETRGSQQEIRRRVLKYWTGLVVGLGMRPFSHTRLIKGSHGQRLYWLMLASRHPLAEKLWRSIGRADGQGELAV